VRARFTVKEDLEESLRVGVFSEPGKQYDAWIRFSNADVRVSRDTKPAEGASPQKHGSRGMAIKLLGVTGCPLVETPEPLTQDFLLINQPVFAFANAEDYEALSEVLVRDKDRPEGFFARIRMKDGKPDLSDPATVRALRTKEIFTHIFIDPPPASPVEAQYFSASPFLFGADHAVKFSAKPVSPPSGKAPDFADPNYLRTALIERLAGDKAVDVVFDFLVQRRTACELADKIDTAIEDACQEWKETDFPFASVATITIPPQHFDTPERRAVCERLVFTPWHGVQEHKPLGSINRLRLAVYQASSHHRLFPKEPARMTV
jgi:catalase